MQKVGDRPIWFSVSSVADNKIAGGQEGQALESEIVANAGGLFGKRSEAGRQDEFAPENWPSAFISRTKGGRKLLGVASLVQAIPALLKRIASGSTIFGAMGLPSLSRSVTRFSTVT